MLKRQNGVTAALKAQINGIHAQYYKYQGKYAQAEPYFRKRLELLLEIADRNPRGGINARMDLCANLRKQKRLLEAEIEARKALREALGLGGEGRHAGADRQSGDGG